MFKSVFMGHNSLLHEINYKLYILNKQKFFIGSDSYFRSSSSFSFLWVPFDTIQALNRLPYQILEIAVCLSLISCQGH